MLSNDSINCNAKTLIYITRIILKILSDDKMITIKNIVLFII